MARFKYVYATSTMVTKMEADTQLYRSRFLMLFLFVMYSMSNAFQWIEYSIITNIVSRYYNVEEFAINWTSMIYMASYIPLIFPANWILEKMGLRFAVLLGSFATCLAYSLMKEIDHFIGGCNEFQHTAHFQPLLQQLKGPVA